MTRVLVLLLLTVLLLAAPTQATEVTSFQVFARAIDLEPVIMMEGPNWSVLGVGSPCCFFPPVDRPSDVARLFSYLTLTATLTVDGAVLDRALWFPPGTEPLRILITYDPGFVLPDPFFDEAGAIQWAPYDLGFTWTAEVSFLGGGQGAGSGVLHGEWTNNPDEGGAFWTQIYTSTVAPPATAVAEPATALLLLAGLAGIAARLRRRPHEHA